MTQTTVSPLLKTVLMNDKWSVCIKTPYDRHWIWVLFGYLHPNGISITHQCSFCKCRTTLQEAGCTPITITAFCLDIHRQLRRYTLQSTISTPHHKNVHIFQNLLKNAVWTKTVNWMVQHDSLCGLKLRSSLTVQKLPQIFPLTQNANIICAQQL